MTNRSHNTYCACPQGVTTNMGVIGVMTWFGITQKARGNGSGDQSILEWYQYYHSPGIVGNCISVNSLVPRAIINCIPMEQDWYRLITRPLLPHSLGKGLTTLDSYTTTQLTQWTLAGSSSKECLTLFCIVCAAK